jgi:UDP-N-acetylmuramyl pentapeptide phosphotransferase/UDP-N-acetylglucosamine-1-phosphate transferase
MKDFIINHKFGFLFLIPGIIGGYLYWRYVGCLSGTCPLKSNWETMVLFGGLIGYFLGDIIDDYIKKKNNKKDELPGDNQ